MRVYATRQDTKVPFVKQKDAVLDVQTDIAIEIRQETSTVLVVRVIREQLVMSSVSAYYSDDII